MLHCENLLAHLKLSNKGGEVLRGGIGQQVLAVAACIMNGICRCVRVLDSKVLHRPCTATGVISTASNSKSYQYQVIASRCIIILWAGVSVIHHTNTPHPPCTATAVMVNSNPLAASQVACAGVWLANTKVCCSWLGSSQDIHRHSAG